MSNAIKAALLSGLILPGLGQLALKRYFRGAILVFAVLASLAAILHTVTQEAFSVLESIQSGDGAIDIDAISAAAAEASTASRSLTINLAGVALLVCWIAGTVDAYFIGRKRDIADASIDREKERK